MQFINYKITPSPVVKTQSIPSNTSNSKVQLNNVKYTKSIKTKQPHRLKHNDT